MQYLSITASLVVALAVSACSNHGATPARSTDSTASLSSIVPRETVLLVSLEDGSIIKQTINSSADFCFKSNSASTTTCLTQGEPVIDPATNTVVGFKMIEDRIDLVAKSD